MCTQCGSVMSVHVYQFVQIYKITPWKSRKASFKKRIVNLHKNIQHKLQWEYVIFKNSTGPHGGWKVCISSNKERITKGQKKRSIWFCACRLKGVMK